MVAAKAYAGGGRKCARDCRFVVGETVAAEAIGGARLPIFMQKVKKIPYLLEIWRRFVHSLYHALAMNEK